MSNASINQRTDVIIIGAGPVGLTLGNELARRGIGVRIIDKASSIREVSKALIWHVRTQEILDKVGIVGKGIAEAAAMTEVVVHAYGKHIGSWKMDGIDSPYPNPQIIGQNRTQHLLKALLEERGVKVEWNVEAVALELDDDGGTITLHHRDPSTQEFQEERLRARYVIGCEGSKSLVRKTLGITFEGEHYSGEQFIQADCKVSWNLPSGRSYLFLTPDGYMMAIELPGGLVRIFISIPDSIKEGHKTAGQQAAENSLGAAEDISSEPSLSEVQEHFERLSGLRVELSAPIWLARYRTSHRYANKFGEGCAFIAGDSGHVHVPIGGQGMNTGIQDAFNLGWKLAGVIRNVYKKEILATYNEERHEVAKNLIKGTDFAYKGILHPSQVKQSAVKLIGPFVIRTETAQNFMRNTLEELNISYPNSSLSMDLYRSSGPQAGERVLDAPVVQCWDKRTVHLNSLLRAAEWTLLYLSGTKEKFNFDGYKQVVNKVKESCDSSITTYLLSAQYTDELRDAISGNVLLDTLHYAHQKYAIDEATIVLIRPDNYIGFRGGVQSLRQLDTYLSSIFKQPFAQ